MRADERERESGREREPGRVVLRFLDESWPGTREAEAVPVCEVCGEPVPVVVVRLDELATWRVVA